MSRSNRMFEIIQLLRVARQPMTARDLAERLEVTPRTVYRDVAALQAMRVPIEGAAGFGYVMRAGYDLPPVMFSQEEVEAIVVGLALLRRTGDAGLLAAADRVAGKVAAILPADAAQRLGQPVLLVSGWHEVPEAAVDSGLVRQAIRDERRLAIAYRDVDGETTDRTILPLATIYYVESVVLAAWCELRRDFRHFRLDRMAKCVVLDTGFAGDGDRLRAAWQAQHAMPSG